MWAVAILLNDGRLLHYDVAAETERQARDEARGEMIAEMAIEQEWMVDPLIRAMVVGRL